MAYRWARTTLSATTGQRGQQVPSRPLLANEGILATGTFLIPGFAGKLLFESGQISVLGRKKLFGSIWSWILGKVGKVREIYI